MDIRSLATTSQQPTTLAFVALSHEGVPTFSFCRHPGADLSLKPSDIDLTVFDAAQVFHFGSLSLVLPPAQDATRYCLQTARDRKLFVTYDPNYRPALWLNEESAREKMLEPLPFVDLLKVSREELHLLSGLQEEQAAAMALLQRGPAWIIITRGGEGMAAYNRDGICVRAPGIPVEVADTTGCGDSAMAGLLAYLITGGVRVAKGVPIAPADLERALNYANRCAAHTAQTKGAIPALPRTSDLPRE